MEATRAYVAEVRSGAFPSAAHSFGMAKPRTLGEATGTAPVVEEQPPGYGPASDEP